MQAAPPGPTTLHTAEATTDGFPGQASPGPPAQPTSNRDVQAAPPGPTHLHAAEATTAGERTAPRGKAAQPTAPATPQPDDTDVLDNATAPLFGYDSDDDDDTDTATLPVPPDLDRLFGDFAPNPTATTALHERYPVFRTANIATFADIIALSEMYAPRKAIPTASAHATAYFATHPRLDTERIAHDTATATRDDIDA